MAGPGTETRQEDSQVGWGDGGDMMDCSSLLTLYFADDDKIRLQLYLDVSYFLKELGSGTLGCLAMMTGSEKGAMIKQVVEESVDRFINELNL